MKTEAELRAALKAVEFVIESGRALATTRATAYALQYALDDDTVGSLMLKAAIEATQQIQGLSQPSN